MKPPPFLSAKRWRTLEPLLDAALELPPEHRASFLDGACGDDAELRSDLASMLEECATADAHFALPAAQRFAALLDGREEFERLKAALASHYAVERELGCGGMGTVYLARDLRHDREVALKVLAPELADGTNAVRFLDEIRLTARLRHPHILPLFDSGVADGRPWYVTPYVEGGTLRDRLRQEGPLPLPDALRVLREVASALAHAHARGVVHRDVKPENVLLDASGAVLGDFGIARALEHAVDGSGSPVIAAHTAPGFGTPAYMAPEQGACGAPADHRVDLYSLGVVAYEMLIGRPPAGARRREGADAGSGEAWSAAIARLHPEAPTELATLVARLLSERPEDRTQSAGEVLRALDTIDSIPGTSGPGLALGTAHRMAGRRRALRGAIAAASLVVLAGGTGWAVRSWRGAVSLPARRVLVVPFENATAEPALEPLGRMAADWVAQGLAETGAVDVSSEVVPSEGRSDQRLREVARQRGAGTLVSGTYYLDGDSVRLMARITNVANWTLLRAVAPVAAARDAPQMLLEPLRQRVMAVLALTHDPRIAGWVMGSPPPTFEAYEQFIAGLDLFSAGHWAEALPLWARAAALDSAYVQPLLHSVSAYINLGRFAEADSLVRIVARREALTPFDRAMLDFQRGEVDGDNMGALAGARAMARVAPGAELPHYLHALTALRVNRPREALEATSRTSSRAGRFGTAWSSANYWALVTRAHHLLGQHEAELRAARTARDLHPDNRELLAFEVLALAALGRLDGLERMLTRLEELPAIPSGRPLARIFLEIADELAAHGHPASARDVLLRADRWQHAQSDDAKRPPGDHYDRARILHRLGGDAEADMLFARLEAEHPEDARHLLYRALIALRQNRAADAERIAERLRTLQVPYDHGLTTFARAQIAAQMGDHAHALALLRLALAEGYSFGMVMHTNPALAPLRDEPEFRELLRPKG